MVYLHINDLIVHCEILIYCCVPQHLGSLIVVSLVLGLLFISVRVPEALSYVHLSLAQEEIVFRVVQ